MAQLPHKRSSLRHLYSNEARCAAKNAVLTQRFLDTYKQLGHVVGRLVSSIETQRRRQERKAEFAGIAGGGSSGNSSRRSSLGDTDDVIIDKFSPRRDSDDVTIIPYLTREVYETIPGNNDGNRTTPVILRAGSLRKLSLPGDNDTESTVPTLIQCQGPVANDVIEKNNDDDDDDDRPILTRSSWLPSEDNSESRSRSKSRSRLPSLLLAGVGVRSPQPSKYIPSTREIIRDAKKWAEQERQKEIRRVSFKHTGDADDDGANMDGENDASTSLQDQQDGEAAGREARERRSLLLKQKQRERRTSFGGIASNWASPAGSRRSSLKSESSRSSVSHPALGRQQLSTSSNRKRVSLNIPWNANFSPRSSDASLPSLGQLKAWRKRRFSLPVRLFLAIQPSSSGPQQCDYALPASFSGRLTNSTDRLLLQQADGLRALPSQRSRQDMLRSAFDRESRKYTRLQEMMRSFIAQQPPAQPAISHWKTSKGDLVVWNQRRPSTSSTTSSTATIDTSMTSPSSYSTRFDF